MTTITDPTLKKEILDLFNEQKEKLNTIFNRTADFLSKNQFIN